MIATARSLTYTENQLVDLGKKLPDQATLEAIRAAGMMLMAGPPTAMSMLDVRSLYADYLYSMEPDQNDAGWYDDSSQKFSCNDKIEALGWIAFRKVPAEGSLNKNWSEQADRVKAPFYVPNAAEATWCITTYHAVNGTYLFDKRYVRTASFDSDGNRVNVGYFDGDGLNVFDYWDDSRRSDLGVASARKT